MYLFQVEGCGDLFSFYIYRVHTRNTRSRKDYTHCDSASDMSIVEKSKLAVVQDDILAVKYALANGIAFEGLEGEALTDLLATLQAQRSGLLSATASKVSARRELSTKVVAKTAQAQLKEVEQSKVVDTGAAKTTPIGTPPKTEPQQSGSHPKKAAKRKSPASSGGGKDAQKKLKHKRGDNPLRQLRKTIKVGDVVSVLMDVRMANGWGRSWVRGGIRREMNRGGIFQIAFDHDNVMTKLLPSQEDDKGWLREQRLEIDHPDFFCGTGNDPPVGADESRPKGAWYLHSGGERASTAAEIIVDTPNVESSNGNAQSDDNHLLEV